MSRIISTYVENTKIPTGATGITSTYVENTFSILRHNGLDKDHLHIRGEYYFLQKIGSGNKGSPPHTWRIPLDSNLSQLIPRITSTYVENTASDASGGAIGRDHLHIRGEYHCLFGSLFQLLGSPPHTWRIPIFQIPTSTCKRITSTYVENTMSYPIFRIAF